MAIDRRFFLQTAFHGTATASLALANPWTSAFAADAVPVKRKKTLVVLFLRGGVDGLNLVVPHGESRYYGMRPTIAVPRPDQPNGCLDLDGRFGLHPRLAPLQPYFRDGYAAAMHAVGYDDNSRSHFREQDVWETASVEGSASADGWLNRHLATSKGHGPIRAVTIGNQLPRILQGDAAAYAMRGLDQLSLPKGEVPESVVTDALAKAYGGVAGTAGRTGDLLAQSGDATLEALKHLERVRRETPPSKVEYPRHELAQRLREVARLIRADIGLEVAELDYGGWDTHRNQGAAGGGGYGNQVGAVGASLAAFCRDLEDRLDDVLIVTLSDFGRTAAENGTRGTDHGWGNCLLALGGALRTPKDEARGVLGKWPGLDVEQLHQRRDLQHTTDFRDVLAEVVRDHLGNSKVDRVITGRGQARVGLIPDRRERRVY